jgi:hypothetical protein
MSWLTERSMLTRCCAPGPVPASFRSAVTAGGASIVGLGASDMIGRARYHSRLWSPEDCEQGRSPAGWWD